MTEPRTFKREAWLAALDAWKEGDFGPEWKDVRHEAVMRGMIYPPEGSKWDSWEDDSPSQRAMLVRAMRETPALLHSAISRSRSWGEVIMRIIRERDDWRRDQAHAERLRADDEGSPYEATVALKRIIERIGDS